MSLLAYVLQTYFLNMSAIFLENYIKVTWIYYHIKNHHKRGIPNFCHTISSLIRYHASSKSAVIVARSNLEEICVMHKKLIVVLTCVTGNDWFIDWRSIQDYSLFVRNMTSFWCRIVWLFMKIKRTTKTYIPGKTYVRTVIIGSYKKKLIKKMIKWICCRI